MKIEVVFAKPRETLVACLSLNSGAKVYEALEAVKKLNGFESFGSDGNTYGVFGSEVMLEEVLKEGDRLEIYRPLQCDPKELRRRRQKRGEKRHPRNSFARSAIMRPRTPTSWPGT